VLVVGIASCSSTGGKPQEHGGGMGAGTANTPRATVAMITHEVPGDSFWDLIRKGAQAAADKDNIELRYSNDPEAPNQANLVQSAIDSKVNGIAVTLPNPAALTPVVQKAIAAGIPVVALNAGDRDWQKTGALAFFGEPEVLAGEFAGTELNKIGAKHALCVIQSQGQVQLEDRCQGLASKFSGTSDKLYAEGTDTPSYVSLVTAKMRQDPSIDAVVTLGPALGVAVQQELEQQGSKAKVATYAFNNDLIPLLQNGKVAFTIDQQPYLQGYLSIDSLWLYKKNKSVIGAQQSVPTGPVVIDQSNIGDIAQDVTSGLR